MKDLTKPDVVDVAIGLCTINGSVTTLDVKRSLRKQRFWATQAEVSVLMNEAYEDGELEFEDLGTHRVYSIAKASTTMPTPAIVTTLPAALKASVPPPINDPLVLKTACTGCWIASCSGLGVAQIMFVDENVSRSKARWLFGRIHGVSYNQVRAARQK
jgi:hypothetical protein